MATITRRDTHSPEHRWQAKVRLKGFPVQSKSFPTKAEAENWAQSIEAEMRRGTFVDTAAARATTLGDLLQRYAERVSPTKKSGEQEVKRIRSMLAWPLCQYAAANVSPAVLAEWRDERLQSVSGSTVNRELNLLSHVFSTAMIEWAIHLPANPVSRIRRPKHNKPRNRRTEGGEESLLLYECKRARNKHLYPAVLLAIETGMRRSEIVGIEWANINLDRRVLWLPDSKNDEERTVALSSRAVDALAQVTADRIGPVFPGLTVDAIKCAYRRARSRANIDGLRFHDLRHEATSRLFEKGLNPMEVASITGHKTLSMLQRYTHLRAEDLAKKLG
ncbi:MULTISPECIES: tyrosine-type recombinase/integrase [Burkholderia]|uniref:tyrosine-type recombinase/integrase n=1 Tax=Burkholderia TaxID=32008 RepID=UPI00075E72FC|nr:MULTISPECIES: site-specific integrase [Burkholderia]AOJ68310.1 integrase [Burkholderia savannae]KVG41880.1 integrase [Burkholderia sp. MSMB0265]KVG86465.1 integrase [Burkholderia sp. MSMB2040]KVG98682.1 integrase [Burkholderia sp. MSMB2041]KVG99477.1 integrase [Burkholderia sp. MSMB2042]